MNKYKMGMLLKRAKDNSTAMGAGVVAIVGLVTYLGYGVDYYKVDSCNATVSRYVKANYSDTTLTMNSDGTSSVDTDYWDELASEVYTISKVNQLPEYPPMPPHDKSMANDLDFDRFSFHTDESLKVFLSYGQVSTRFTETIGKTKRCLDKLDKIVEVKTWYSITYGSDF